MLLVAELLCGEERKDAVPDGKVSTARTPLMSMLGTYVRLEEGQKTDTVGGIACGMTWT